jgi:diacylglycerol O-acyltransferase
MHIGGVLVFDGPAPAHHELADHIEQRLALVPRFRQRLAAPPFGVWRPFWVEDPDFELDYHLRRAALPSPGGERQLAQLVAQVFSERLDRRRPLWEMYVVEGLRGDRFALITKTHHALVDGIASVDLASVILDMTPQPPGAGEHRREVAAQGAEVGAPQRLGIASGDSARWSRPIPAEPGPMPSRAQLLAAALADAARGPAALAQFLVRGGLFYPRHLLRELAKVGASLGEIGWELLNPAPRVPLNGPIGEHRRYELRRVSLERVRALKRCYGATVNDVVLAVATGALRRWLLSRGVRTRGLELRALVPVNLRTDAERGLLGNRVALLRAPLPVYASDPVHRLERVRDAMRELKRSGQLAAAQTIIELSDFAPPTVLAQASRLNFSPRLFNLIITNVPGPQFPLYLLGRRLATLGPVAFLPEGHGLSIAVFSYDGQLAFGLLGDYDRLDDLDLLATGITESLQELCAAAGVEPHSAATVRAPIADSRRERISDAGREPLASASR